MVRRTTRKLMASMEEQISMEEEATVATRRAMAEVTKEASIIRACGTVVCLAFHAIYQSMYAPMRYAK